MGKIISILLKEKTEAQRGYVICPESHKEELEHKVWSFDLVSRLFSLFTFFPRRVPSKGELLNQQNTETLAFIPLIAQKVNLSGISGKRTVPTVKNL